MERWIATLKGGFDYYIKYLCEDEKNIDRRVEMLLVSKSWLTVMLFRKFVAWRSHKVSKMIDRKLVSFPVDH